MMRRLFRLPWRTTIDIRDDVDAELRFHLEVRAEELIRAGTPPDHAHAQALREFGDIGDARRYINRLDRKAESERRRRDYVRELAQDVSYAFRKLRKAPTLAFTAILTLALGIGANAAIFSVVHGVLLKPVPFPHPEQLFRVWSANRTAGD